MYLLVFIKIIQNIIKSFHNNFSLAFGVNFKHVPNDFHSDSDPRLKMLMFRITTYLEWILTFFGYYDEDDEEDDDEDDDGEENDDVQRQRVEEGDGRQEVLCI